MRRFSKLHGNEYVFEAAYKYNFFYLFLVKRNGEKRQRICSYYVGWGWITKSCSYSLDFLDYFKMAF